MRVALGERWAVTYAMGYSFERSLFLANRGGLEYQSACRCWRIGVEVRSGRGEGTQVSVTYRLTGLGQASKGRDAQLDELLYVPGLLDAL